MSDISRRRMLRAGAVLTVGGGAGALLTRSISTEVRAAETALAVEGDETVVRGGSLAALTLDLSVGWEYTVPSGENPEEVVVEVLAGLDGDGLEVLDSAASSQVFLSAGEDEHFEVDLLDADAIDAEALVPDDEGAVEETTIYVGTEMRLYDENGLVIAADSQVDTATVSVELSDYDADEKGDVTGEGEITIEDDV